MTVAIVVSTAIDHTHSNTDSGGATHNDSHTESDLACGY